MYCTAEGTEEIRCLLPRTVVMYYIRRTQSTFIAGLLQYRRPLQVNISICMLHADAAVVVKNISYNAPAPTRATFYRLCVLGVSV